MALAKLTTRKLLDSIQLTENKLAEMKADLKDRPADLSKDSTDMQAVLDALQKAADSNKVSVSEVIMAASRIKKTGLKIVKSTRKPRTKKTTEAKL